MTVRVIIPNAIYDAAALRQIIGGSLLKRIKSSALSRDHYLGKHVLEALDSLEKGVNEISHEPATITHVATLGRKGGGKRETPRKNRVSFDQVKLQG